MDLNVFQEIQQKKETKDEIITLWEKIKANYFGKKTPLYLEWLVFRLILMFGGFKNKIDSVSNMKLDKNYEPLSCSPRNKADLVVIYDKGIGLEVTERPIPGKIEHFSHIDIIKDEFKINDVIGCLVSKINIDKIPSETWNIYKQAYVFRKKLYIICDVDLLIKLINKENQKELFINFVKKSEQIWKLTDSWESIKKQIIILKGDILKNGNDK